MLRYGPTFFPTSYQIPYPDYPATSTCLIWLFSLPWGKVTVLSATLPTAITSALILVFIYRIGAIHSREWALLAVLFALFTYEFMRESRRIALDQYTSLVTVLCFYLACSASVFGRRKRLWFIPWLYIIGFAFRGPIGLVIPAMITCSFYMWEKQYKTCLLFGLAALVLFGLCSGLLLAAAYQQGGDSLVSEVIKMQVVGRIHTYSNNYFYYLVKGFSAYAVSFPLAVVVLIFQFKNIFNRENEKYKLLGHMALWMGIILLGLSIPGTKKTRYLLPIVPALSLLAAYMFVHSDAKGILAGVRNIFLGGCHKLPLVAVGAAVLLCIPNPYFTSIPLWPGFVGVALLVCLVVISFKMNRKDRENPYKNLAVITIAVLSFMVFNIWTIGPLIYTSERSRPFVEKVESLLRSRPGSLAFYQMGPNLEDIKFMANVNASITPIFLENEEDLRRQSTTTCFIAGQTVFENLPQAITREMQVHGVGNIGHRKCVIFSRKYDLAEQCVMITP
ncbi:MAG: hypothetical protein JW860_12525 [Sedimentisphaerales bacterium]|nr:hypothetical protein [Sedimentisphaerales bacterium]